jgi:hypothetical protein
MPKDAERLPSCQYFRHIFPTLMHESKQVCDLEGVFSTYPLCFLIDLRSFPSFAILVL